MKPTVSELSGKLSVKSSDELANILGNILELQGKFTKIDPESGDFGHNPTSSAILIINHLQFERQEQRLSMTTRQRRSCPALAFINLQFRESFELCQISKT